MNVDGVEQAGAARWSADVRRRMAGLSFDGLRVRKAKTTKDLSTVASLREQGFGRLLPVEEREEFAWLSEEDYAANTTLLLIETLEGTALATMRVQDGRKGPVELSRFVALGKMLSEQDLPLIQCARLATKKSDRTYDAIHGMLKGTWRWACREGIESIVLATPRWSRPIYDALMFRDLGPSGQFLHGYGVPAQHRSMILSARRAEALYRENDHPLCRQLFDISHPLLELS